MRAHEHIRETVADAGLLDDGGMREIEPRISDDVFTVLSVDRSVKSRTSFGGTAPRNVRAQAKKWLRKLEKAKS